MSGHTSQCGTNRRTEKTAQLWLPSMVVSRGQIYTVSTSPYQGYPVWWCVISVWDWPQLSCVDICWFIESWGIWLQSEISKFQTHFNDKYLKYFQWNCYQVNATTPHWSWVNIGSDNGLVPSLSVRQQAIVWANVDLDPCRHMTSLGHSELRYVTSNTQEANQWNHEKCEI